MNCTPYKDNGKRHTYIYTREHFVKNMSCGYKMVTVIRVRLTAAAIGDRMGAIDRTASRTARTEAGGKK